MYRAFGLITPSARVSAESLVAPLKAAFPDSSVTLAGRQITIAKGDWEFELLEADGPEVLAESVSLAEKLAGHEDAVDIESCARRIEIWSDTPDPMLEYFERYQTVVGVLKSIPGVIVIDPDEPSFL